MSLSLCMVLGSVLILFFTCSCPVFPAPFVEEAVFAPLCILACFVKNKVSIGARVYFWAFCLFPLVYISVFVPVPNCLDDCSFVSQFSHSVVSNSLQPHESQHDRPPCPSPTPGVHSNSCPSVSDAIQPSHPLSSPSPALNPSQHQSLFQWVNLSCEVAEILKFQSFQWTPRTELL